MTRDQFDTAFKPMVQALAVKMNPAQAQYFWEEFQGVPLSDFQQACHELAMGTPGFLPKLPTWRKAIDDACQGRLTYERTKRDQEAEQFFRNGPSGGKDYGTGAQLWARCCFANIRHILLENDPNKSGEAKRFILESLKNEEMVAYCDTWRTRGGEHPILWLSDQVMVS